MRGVFLIFLLLHLLPPRPLSRPLSGRARRPSSPAPSRKTSKSSTRPEPRSERAERAGGSGASSALAKWRQLPREEPGSWVPPPLEAQLEAIGMEHHEDAAKVMAEGKELELELEEVYPEKHRTTVEMHKLQRILQPLSPLFLPQLPPIPDTWMFESKETPQSFKDYVLERPPAPARAHYKIYLLPLTEPGGGHEHVGTLPDLRILQRFVEAWFDLPCKVGGAGWGR